MAARSKGPKGSKGSDPHDLVKPQAVTLKITVDRETARLLRLEAFGRDVSLGLVVAEMVRNTPRRFVLMDRAKGSVGAEGPGHPEGRPAEGGSRPPGAHPALGLVSEAG